MEWKESCKWDLLKVNISEKDDETLYLWKSEDGQNPGSFTVRVTGLSVSKLYISSSFTHGDRIEGTRDTLSSSIRG